MPSKTQKICVYKMTIYSKSHTYYGTCIIWGNKFRFMRSNDICLFAQHTVYIVIFKFTQHKTYLTLKSWINKLVSRLKQITKRSLFLKSQLINIWSFRNRTKINKWKIEKLTAKNSSLYMQIKWHFWAKRRSRWSRKSRIWTTVNTIT